LFDLQSATTRNQLENAIAQANVAGACWAKMPSHLQKWDQA
jgi:hypothetical protein